MTYRMTSDQDAQERASVVCIISTSNTNNFRSIANQYDSPSIIKCLMCMTDRCEKARKTFIASIGNKISHDSFNVIKLCLFSNK